MKLIDISHVLDGNTPIFPGDYQTALTVHKTIEKDYYNSYLLESCLHTGTHIDMPMHLIDESTTAAEFPPECFCGWGVLLDVRGEDPIAMKPVYKDMIREKAIVLLFTGCDKDYGNNEYFSSHPSVSSELGSFLISKKIKILGMDMPSPDHSPYALHKALLKAGIFVLENLTNLGALTDAESFEVMALPLKIRAEASFVRAVCIV